MSIFKETFKDFVFKQLRIREAIVEQGNAIKDPTNVSSRFGSPREEIEKKGGGTDTITIDKGAFYTNSVSKQCVIRMSSGVDITDSDLLEVDNLDPDGIAIEKTGEHLAKRYILEGGIPIDPTKKSSPRSGGIGRGGAYGSPYIRSDAKDGFGIVPMPGIVDANIRTKTAYGSLREAKVNFVCHNRRQLDVLELLYMRPGFPILLEWQWSPFINNEGKIDNTLYGVIDDWFDETKTINDFNLAVIENKDKSGGNYDGFVGFCKNFEIKARPDGGYDCTTELIAAGEILEGLKARRDGERTTEENEEKEVDNAEFTLQAFNELGEASSVGFAEGIEYKTINDFFTRLTDIPPLSGGEIALELYVQGFINEFFRGFGQTKGDSDSIVSKNSLDTFATKFGEFFIFKGDSLGRFADFWLSTNIDGTTEAQSKYTYVRWDYLCDIVNKFWFPLINPQDPNSGILKLTYTHPLGENNKETYLDFAPPTLPSSGTMLSEVNNINGDYNSSDDVKGKINVDKLLNNSFNPSICLLPPQNQKQAYLAKGYPNKNHIGHIMLNVEHLLKVYKEMAYNDGNISENFNLFDYFQRIWGDVNTSCAGHHNFILQVEGGKTDRVRIIDLQVHNPEIKPKDLFEFKIQSNKSIVRDFNFNTTIPSALSATIAIAAQAPSSVSDLDQITFANFSKGIKSRFTKDAKPVNKTKEEIEKENQKAANKKKDYDKDLKKYRETIANLSLYNLKIQQGLYDFSFWGGGRKIDGKSFGDIVSLANSVTSKTVSLLSRLPNGQKRKTIPSNKSAIIPLKFNAKMDGIGGIVIGHVFKVEKEKLPKGYQADDVAFVVMGESQNITLGQDWSTEISGQLMLLDQVGETVQPIEYGASGGPSKDPDTIAIQKIEKEIATKATDGNTEGLHIPQTSSDGEAGHTNTPNWNPAWGRIDREGSTPRPKAVGNNSGWKWQSEGPGGYWTYLN